MSAFTRAYELQMRALVHDLFSTLDGIPEERSTPGSRPPRATGGTR